MIKKVLSFIIGILFSSYSLMFIIIYLNLLRMDYSFLDYLKYICKILACLIILPGILLIYLSLRRNKKIIIVNNNNGG